MTAEWAEERPRTRPRAPRPSAPRPDAGGRRRAARDRDLPQDWDRPERAERPDRWDRADRAERAVFPAFPEYDDELEYRDRPARGGHSARSDRPERPEERSEWAEQRPRRAARPVRDDGADRTARHSADRPRQAAAPDRPTIQLPPVRAQYRSHRRGGAGKRRAGAAAAGGAAKPEGPILKSVRIFGEVFITFGMVVLLFASYEIWGKQFEVHHVQDKLSQQLANQWKGPKNGPDTPPALGNAIAKLYIPTLRLSLIVVQGTTLQDIRNAPGHYEDSAMPGQVGNFAVAGHRMIGMFEDLDQLHGGEPLVVRDQTNWYIYKVYQQQIVSPFAVSVVNPVPGQPKSVTPTQRLITLTTCNPKWDNYQRLIIHGQLVRTSPVADGKPPELGNLAE